MEKDFEELLRLFNRHKVKYCVVGAFAVAFYAIPRYTKDLDLLVDPSVQNGERIIKALKAFGFGGLDISSDDFAKPGKTVQLGHEPVRIDILTEVDGCKPSNIFATRKFGKLGPTRVPFIGLQELIRNKKATNRSQDKTDLKILALCVSKSRKKGEK